MELHAIRGDTADHILTMHRGDADQTPLQMISSARLEYYMTLERALLAFVESIVSVLPAAPPPEPFPASRPPGAPGAT